MYKSRFKKWGWRKNIRFDRPMVLSNDPRFILPIHLSASGSVSMPESAAAAATITTTTETTYTTNSSSIVPSSYSQSQRHRQYPTLEVQQERLESYLRRRQRRDRARLKNGVVSRVQQAPVAIRPPDRFWASQVVLIHVQQHIVSGHMCHYLFVPSPSLRLEKKKKRPKRNCADDSCPSEKIRRYTGNLATTDELYVGNRPLGSFVS